MAASAGPPGWMRFSGLLPNGIALSAPISPCEKGQPGGIVAMRPLPGAQGSKSEDLPGREVGEEMVFMFLHIERPGPVAPPGGGRRGLRF